VHIVFGIERYWPASGGAEAYVRSIARHLAERHSVTIVTLVRDDNPLTPIRRSVRLPYLPVAWDGPVRIVGLRVGNRERLLLAPILLQMLPHQSRRLYDLMRVCAFEYFARVLLSQFIDAVGDADVVHTVAPWEMSHLANRAKTKLKIPHIMTGLLHPGYWADDSHSAKLFKHCDVIIALLGIEKEAYLRAGVSLNRVRVVGTPSPASIQADRVLFHSTFPTGNPIILFLGAKRLYKGYDVLLEAAPYVWRRIPRATFVFLGPRSKESIALFSQVLDPRVIETDKVSDELRDSALAACNVLCLPSATEIMPNVILEAWTAGKPVVVSNIPTLAELVTGAGLCVPRTPEMIADALIQVLENQNLADRLGAEGMRRAIQEFSVSHIASTLEEIYYECTQQTAVV